MPWRPAAHPSGYPFIAERERLEVRNLLRDRAEPRSSASVGSMPARRPTGDPHDASGHSDCPIGQPGPSKASRSRPARLDLVARDRTHTGVIMSEPLDSCLCAGITSRAIGMDDVRAIHRLKHEFCYAADRFDAAAWATLFTEDGRFVGESSVGTLEGRAELQAFMEDPPFDDTVHTVMNPIVDVNGEAATGQWYSLLLYKPTDGEIGLLQTRYDEEYAKVDGEWLIRESDVTAGLRAEL